jgi:translocation and assembly module TamA
MALKWQAIAWFCMFGVVYAQEVVLPTHQITFDGEKHFDERVLQNALELDTPSILAFWKNDTITIKDKLIPTLMPTLKAFYESEGFYDVNISMQTSDTKVKVKVVENTPVRISNIVIQSDRNISTLITVKIGDIFKAKRFIEIKSKLIEGLLNDGYCSYDLDTKAYVDLDKHTAEFVYILKKGGICTFGVPNIVGLKSIDKKVILSRVRAKEGERFDPKKVKETYASVYSLNAFDGVQIGVDRKFYNVVPLDITLNEVENAYHFEGGVGYDTYIGPRVHASLVKKNFFGNAKKTGIKLSWSAKEQLAVGEYFQPALFVWGGYGIDFGTEFGYQNLEYKGFKEAKRFAKVYLEHNEGRLKLRAGLALENIDISTSDNLKYYETLTQAVSEGNFLLLYPYIDVVYDARDDKLNPKYGYYFSASMEYGVDYKADATSYIKTLIEARAIYTFDKLTLASVAKAGVIDEKTNALPESKLFFAGGSYSNRAYGFNNIGIIASPRSDTIFGASSWLNLSFEADYPMVGKLYGAVFTDNTMLNDGSNDFTGKVITSAGVGVRYLTPIGPFKLDVGFNVNKPSEYGISFQIGQSF